MACNPVEHFHFHSGVLPHGEGANGCNMIPSASVLERPAGALLRFMRSNQDVATTRGFVRCFQLSGNNQGLMEACVTGGATKTVCRKSPRNCYETTTENNGTEPPSSSRRRRHPDAELSILSISIESPPSMAPARRPAAGRPPRPQAPDVPSTTTAQITVANPITNTRPMPIPPPQRALSEVCHKAVARQGIPDTAITTFANTFEAIAKQSLQHAREVKGSSVVCFVILPRVPTFPVPNSGSGGLGRHIIIFRKSQTQSRTLT